MHAEVIQWLSETVAAHDLNRCEYDVLEVGSLNVNGSARDHFDQVGLYWGIDIVDGNGVDVVCNAHDMEPFGDDEFDIVVSCNCIEHDDDDEATMAEIGRVLRPGGHFLLCAPAHGFPQHHPPDYRRYDEADFGRLFLLAGCDLHDVSVDESPGVRGYGVRR